MTLKSPWILTFALGLAATASQAHDDAAAREASPSPSAARSPASPGADASARRVSRDPVTGQFRPPTAQEIAAEQAQHAVAAPVAPLVVRVHPNGMKSAVLTQEYMSTLMVERRPDGSLVKRHANSRDDQMHAMPSNTASKPAAVRGAATE